MTETAADRWKALLQSLALHAAVLGLFALAVIWGLSHPTAMPARAGEAGAPEAVLGALAESGAAPAAEAGTTADPPVPVEIDLSAPVEDGLALESTAPPEAAPALEPPEPANAATSPGPAQPRPPLEAPETVAAEHSTAGAPEASAATGASDDLYSRYLSAIRGQALAAWAPAGTEPLRCQVLLTQLPGGQLVDVAFLDCPQPPAVREALLRAFAKDRPWPYAGYEPVFRSRLRLTLCHPATADCPL